MTLVNDSIDVSDNFATPGSTGDDKHWTDIDATTTLTYPRPFTCGSASGSTAFTNTASIDGTDKTSSWTLTVTCAAARADGEPAANASDDAARRDAARRDAARRDAARPRRRPR